MKIKTITITPEKRPLAVCASQWLLSALILAGGSWPSAATPAAEPTEESAGFAFDRFQLTLEDGWRTEAVGPFFYAQQTEDEALWAFPPFYSNDRKPGVESEEEQIFYPVLTFTRYGAERRWQFCQLLSNSSGRNPDDTETARFTVFPFYFQQRSTDTNLNYTAVAPFYGHLKHRLFRDRIDFVMFPFYVETQKRDRVTDNYLFPIGDVHHGDGMKGWQVWPLAGREHKDVTTQTNGFGEQISIPGHDWSFYLWPFYLSQDNGIGSGDPEKFRASLPFFVKSRAPQRDSTSVLWPMFTTIDDRGRKYHEWAGPWPFVVFGNGDDRHLSRVWPLYSKAHTQEQQRDSWVWPLVTYTRTHADPLDRHRSRVLYYLYSRLVEKNTETGREKIRLDMWPFFTWHHDFDGRERLQVLAPLEPAVPDNPGIERNWSPLWSVWRAEDNPKTGASSRSLLWNFYRRESAPASRKVSCCFGLYQYQAQAAGQTVKLFYLPAMHLH